MFPKLRREFFGGFKIRLMTDTDAVNRLFTSEGLNRNVRIFRFESFLQILRRALIFKRANLNCKDRSRNMRRRWRLKGLSAYNLQFHRNNTCSDQVDLARRADGKIDHTALYPRSTIIDSHVDCAAIGLICNADQRIERKRSVSRGHSFIRIEDFTAGSPAAMIRLGVIRR